MILVSCNVLLTLLQPYLGRKYLPFFLKSLQSYHALLSLFSHSSMISLQRLEKLHIFTLVSRLCIGSSSPTSSKSSLYSNGHRPISQFPRFSTSQVDSHEKRHLQARREEAQAALLDYFYETKNLPFLDAENLSRNSPNFLDRLLKAALIEGDGENDCDFRRLVTRYLRYHPVNEFEAFFESIGLCPSDFAAFLPRVSVSLSDDELLLRA